MSPPIVVPPPILIPRALRAGDPVALVAPSSPFDRTLALRGAGWLAERYRVLLSSSVFERWGYLAGTDERRLAELDWAFRSGARAVIAMRGGYGLCRIADRVDWTPVERDPCWIVGFSDLTVLHVEAARRGIASIHGPMVCSLGRADERARRRWIACLEEPRARRSWGGLDVWCRGSASGVLFGGNLAMLHSCAARRTLAMPRNAILLLEDVGERPYRVDRMLTDLIAGGHCANANAVILGDFTECWSGPDGWEVRRVLRERIGTLGVPVLAGLPVGHALRNDPLVLGGRASVDGEAGILTVGEAPP